MDWKVWYRAEARSAEGGAAIAHALACVPDGDPEVRAALRQGGAVLFPHTTLAGSAEPLARVAASILAEGSSRVVALGVLHGSTLPEPERTLAERAAAGDPGALGQVGGAWTLSDAADTPFGPVAAGPLPEAGDWVRAGGARLDQEFSLDLFPALLAAAARARGTPPPPVTRVFIGPVSGREGEPSIAGAVAAALRPLLARDVALVATGDLVHAGHGYAPAAEVAALPADADRLHAHFEGRVREMLDAAFCGGESARESQRIAREIRSDARHVIPVLAALLGPKRRATLLSFRLTDYTRILGRPPPCVVASALVAVGT